MCLAILGSNLAMKAANCFDGELVGEASDGVGDFMIPMVDAARRLFDGIIVEESKPSIRQLLQPTNFFATMLALWPPKPNELLMAAFTGMERAVFGT